MTSDRPKVFDDLREQFRTAAAREMDAPTPRRRRRRRRTLVVALAGLLATGGIAVGTQLISVGEPKREPQTKNNRYAPNELGLVAATADDPDFMLDWAVVTYTARGGDTCALVGQVLGSQLGVIDEGAFRPFDNRRGGACGDLSSSSYFAETTQLAGRTLIFGRAASEVSAMRVIHDGRLRQSDTGPDGAYLFVFDGPIDLSKIDLTALGDNGSPLSLDSPFRRGGSVRSWS